MIKRIISLLLVVILMLSVVACNESDKVEKPTEAPNSSVTDNTSEESEDLTSSDSEGEDEEEEIEEEYEEEKKIISVPATAQIALKALPAEHSVLLNKNPDRGFRSAEETNMVPEPDVLKDDAHKYTYDKILAEVKKRIQENTLGESVTVSRVYFIMTNYIPTAVNPDRNYYELPQITMDYINNYCKAYKEVGVKMYMGIYYMQYNGQAAYGNNYERIRISTVMHHVEKYWGPLWEKWQDAIYSVGFALLGRYGEWTSLGDSCLPDGKYYYDTAKQNIDYTEWKKLTEEGKQKLVDLVLKTVPEELYINMRQPMYKAQFVSKNHPRYNRIGFSEDAFYGKVYPDQDMGQGYWLPNDSGGWWTMGMKEAPYTIMDGEFFTSRSFVADSIYIPHDTCIPTFSELRMTTFSINHGYGDINTFGTSLEQTVFQGWKGEEVTAESLKKMGVFVAPGWFIDKSGNTVKRNAFEYTRDYLGYRISAENASITGGTKAGEKITVDMTFKNYGFSAAFNLKSGYAILNEKNEIVSSVEVGDPTTWHSSSPTDYSDRTQLTHNLKGTLTLPKEKGTYKVAFFLKNKLGQSARLDNQVEFSNGFNILHMFTID